MKKEKKEGSKKLKIVLLVLFCIIFVCSITVNIILLTKPEKTTYKNDENIIFFGDSITEGYELDKYYPKKNVLNKGISGHQTTTLINRIKTDVYEYNPSKVFLLIGINDMAVGTPKDDILSNIQQIINGIKINRDKAEIFVESIYPINKDFAIETNTGFILGVDNSEIINLNKELEELCKSNNVTYIDVYNKLTDEDGNLRRNYTRDGVHLNDLGYLKITSILEKYIK